MVKTLGSDLPPITAITGRAYIPTVGSLSLQPEASSGAMLTLRIGVSVVNELVVLNEDI